MFRTLRRFPGGSISRFGSQLTGTVSAVRSSASALFTSNESAGTPGLNIATPLRPKPQKGTPTASSPDSASKQPEARAPVLDSASIGEVIRLDEQEHKFVPTVISGFGGGVIGANGLLFHGSIVALPSMTLLWSPKTWEDVTVDSLAFLSFIHPLPDFLLLGSGLETRPVSPEVAAYLRSMKISHETMSSQQACGVFNIMNEEKRRVMACVLCLSPEEHTRYENRNASRFDKQSLSSKLK